MISATSIISERTDIQEVLPFAKNGGSCEERSAIAAASVLVSGSLLLVLLTDGRRDYSGSGSDDGVRECSGSRANIR